MTQIDEVAQKLLDLDEDTLKAQLGIRVQEIGQDTTARSASIESLEEDLNTTPRGFSSDSLALKFGDQFFNKFNIKSYDLMCGELLDPELIAKIEASYKENSEKAAAFLAPALASQLNLPFSIAMIVAVLIIKTLVSATSTVAETTSETVCKIWKENLAEEKDTFNGKESPTANSVAQQPVS